MKKFNFKKSQKGELLCITTTNKAESLLCKFNKGAKLFVRITDYSPFLMSVTDQRKKQHTFLAEWFDTNEDEIQFPSTIFNPNGIIVKFQKVSTKELPFWLKIKYYLGWF